MLGNLIGSRTKNTGKSLKTKSWLPSWVKSFIAHPRTSRTVSADPFSPPTVEIRKSPGVFFPTPVKKSASVMSEMSWVTSHSPQAPAALACTARSGILSRGKWASVSIKPVSARTPKPPPPNLVLTCSELFGSAHGAPMHETYVSLMALRKARSESYPLPKCILAHRREC